MYVCVYVCNCVCMYVCIYVCMYVYMYVCMYMVITGDEQLGNADQNTASRGNSSSKTRNIILLTAIPTIVALLFAGIIVAIFILKKKYR